MDAPSTSACSLDQEGLEAQLLLLGFYYIFPQNLELGRHSSQLAYQEQGWSAPLLVRFYSHREFVGVNYWAHPAEQVEGKDLIRTIIRFIDRINSWRDGDIPTLTFGE